MSEQKFDKAHREPNDDVLQKRICGRVVRKKFSHGRWTRNENIFGVSLIKKVYYQIFLWKFLLLIMLFFFENACYLPLKIFWDTPLLVKYTARLFFESKALWNWIVFVIFHFQVFWMKTIMCFVKTTWKIFHLMVSQNLVSHI